MSCSDKKDVDVPSDFTPVAAYTRVALYMPIQAVNIAQIGGAFHSVSILNVSHLISFSDLIKSCSEDLFENAHKSNHCLHELVLPMFFGQRACAREVMISCCQPVLVIYTNSHL